MKPAQATIGPEKDLLRQIARVLVISDEPVAEPIDGPPVPFDYHVEGTRSFVETARHQLRFAEIH
ncbi:MAG: hypothetical protein DMF90_06585 [Acidobacteria bacterium]|nr:MAG: hypothetical protein DMF90_06585 [Acidobacteriota bacterium]